MFLYNFPLLPPTSITRAVVGSFSGGKQQEICLCRGESQLELVRVDPNTGKMITLLTHHVFGVVRSLSPFRLTGANKDHLVVGSDSGRIVILDYDAERKQFVKVHQETYGKTGCRRYVPGQYLAIDPMGRAIMISAMERQKLVYVMNRDAASRLTISSPLEAHKSHTLIYSVVGLDVAFENPIFACLELDFGEVDSDSTGVAAKEVEKLLTFYELDLGLNHVVRKWSEPVDRTANLLISLPAGNGAPGGVLVCSENWISWRNENAREVRIPIPRRSGLEDTRGILVNAYAVHKMKKLFFVFVQTEFGDVFKLTLQTAEKNQVSEIKIKYFDTIPVASALCILKSGFLFTPTESGNHLLYQIESLGEEDGENEFSSNSLDRNNPDAVYYFQAHPMQHFALVGEMENFAPLIDAKLYNLIEDDTPQIYALCGRGARSSFRIMRRGLETSEVVSYPLPGNPTAVWSLKATKDDEFDSYIVISFINATLVLSVGETVEEVTDTGFLADTATLNVSQIGQDSILQIYPGGVRHILPDRRVNEWTAPLGTQIVQSTTNNRQVAVALSNNELVYFELDDLGQLNEYQERREFHTRILCVAVGQVPEGRQRSPFLAVGCDDQTVRILSLDPDTCMEPLGMQALNANPSSLLIASMVDFGSDTGHETLYLNIGMENGVLLRNVLDQVTGTLSDTRSRYLGVLPVRLFPIQQHGMQTVLALSSRPWLSYTYQNRYNTTPVTYEMLGFASGFSSEQCPQGIVGISGGTLRILTIDRVDSEFNTAVIPLNFTPRQVVLEPTTRNFIIIESDHQAQFPASLLQQLNGGMETDGGDQEFPVEQFGLPRAPPGHWASCIRQVNPFEGETVQLIPMEGNECTVCITTCIFHADPTHSYVMVGTAQNLTLAPRKCDRGFLYTFRINEQNLLELVHKTEMEDVPTSLCAFQGRLLAGVGKLLRIYDLGKRKLLRKCEWKAPNLIVGLETQGDRVVVNDVQESSTFVRYELDENKLVAFVDDHKPRWITKSCMVDYNTVAAGDKFGNFFVNRMPQDLLDELAEDTGKQKPLADRGFLNGAPYRFDTRCHYYVGDTITSLNKSAMVAGGRQVLVYTTMGGSIGIFAPFISRDDVDFFQNLEMHLRNEAPPLCGRDHLTFRSYFLPVKNAVDGNLIEQYILLSAERKQKIAEEMDRSISEICRQIELIRARVS